MTFVSPDWVTRDEEPRLAEYLVKRVCGRAAGTFEAECTHSAPRDKYFIGSLRPCPPDPEREPGAAVYRAGFPDELLTKLAPMAIGAEFRVKPEGSDFLSRIRLEWSCYYRVFPALDEQREHQRHASAVAGSTASGESSQPTEVSEGRSTDVEEEADGDSDDPVQSPSGPAPTPPGRRGRRPTDVLFPKYRKIRCSAQGCIALRKASAADESWSIDVADLQRATEREVAGVRDVILADPDHLRTGPNPEERVRVPPEALESGSAYAEFKEHLSTDLAPPWRWAIGSQLRPADEPDEVIFSLEATNSSPIDTRAWHSEGFFFDVRATLTFEHANVLPFELDVAPRSFRYDRQLWGRGFNCAVVRTQPDSTQCAFETTNVPVYSQARYSTNTKPRASFQDLSTNPVPVLQRVLDAMQEYNREWIAQRDRYVAEDPAWKARHGDEYERDHRLFRAEIERFAQGCRLIEQDADARLAFQLANQSFALGGQKTEWRLFQVIFIVSQIPGIHALKSSEQSAMLDRSVVDIIYFPTGGGKTEAYLGVIVFHCFFDRLRGKASGITTWTRFPLRLLTLQQTQRVADVIGAAELIRRAHSDPRLSGREVDGFAVGYFVGQEATPNELTPPRRGEPPDLNWSTANDPDARQRWKKIVKCPACRTSSVVVEFDPDRVRLTHRCCNPGCRFPGGILPVYVVDNEIYRFLPAVLVGTIDKLAGLGNQRKLSLVLGQVTGRCVQHGYYNGKCCQKDCSDVSRLRPGSPPGVSGPTLFIQDELHLLKEGLGTFDGHYETFLQTLLQTYGQHAPVKIIASSATIEAFDRQVRHLYGREARVYPGLGPTLSSSFYARTLDYPQRLFVGLLPHNKTIFNAVLELVQYYHEETETLVRLPAAAVNPFGGGQCRPATPLWRSLVDSYATSLCYFSATRELSSIRTDLDAHVNNELERAGFSPLRIAELSGSTSTDNVTRTLELLETAQPGHPTAPNAILATSMIAHGVDIDRLNCMILYGMPKQNAEYIQSSSRVGRSHVGIVFTCLKPARERDQSHFAYFQKYHEFLGQLVEPVAINRWSKFSIQRTLPGLFMAVLLQRIANNSGQDNPNRYYMVNFVKRLISEGTLRAENFLGMLDEAYLIDRWPGPGTAAFQEEIGRRVRQFLDQILGAGDHAKFVSEALVPQPMRNLRDVDEQIEIELDPNGSAWASRAGR
ncbi:MAG: helicase C-terminal domain-containing protein [Bacillota bacterium]